MKSLADKENPQGILAIVRERQTNLADLAPVQTAAALVSPQDPGNVGTILRTLDAVGAEALIPAGRRRGVVSSHGGTLKYGHDFLEAGCTNFLC